MSSRHLLPVKLLAPFCVVLLTASACSSDDGSTNASGNVISTSEQLGNARSSSSDDSAVEVDDRDPTELIDDVIVQESDLTPDYTYEIVPSDTDEPCEGVIDADVSYPPAESLKAEFSAGHFFETAVAVFDDEQAAIDHYQANLDAAEQCSGEISVDPETGESVYNEIADYSLEPLGSETDEEGAFKGTVTTAELSVDVLVVHARVGNVVLASTGSDIDTTIALEQLMLARLNGDTEQAITLPSGAPTLGPGDAALGSGETDDGTGTGSDIDYATDARNVVSGPLGEELDPAARDWLLNLDDATINDLTMRSCDELTKAQAEGTSLEEAFLTIYIDSSPEVRNALEPEQLGEAIGALLFVGCPEVIPALGAEFGE